MNTYFTNITDSDGITYEDVYVCDMKAADVDKATTELKRYMARKGNIYALDPYKNPTYEQFIKLYFGEMFGDYRTWYATPEEYRCSNKNVAERLYNNILRHLKYHDTFNQRYCDVIVERSTVFVCHGDY